MLEFSDIAEIDYIGQFSPKQQVLDYVEHLSYYKNQPEVEWISDTYDKFVNDTNALDISVEFPGERKLDKLTFSGFQWEVDRHCWASVIRETINDDRYYSLTEKTLRAFLHHTVPIPIGFGGVASLEKLGFWFPRDIIDYSYQSQPLFSDRVNGIVSALRKISKDYSFAQLQDFYLDNLQNFQHNAELVYKYINKQETYL
jgi:hypothetical protein